MVTFRESVARCTGLRLPTVIECKLIRFVVGEADFEIANRSGAVKGRMLFYNEDAQKVERLSVGKIYRFSARIEDYDEGIVMFYDPDQTKFSELSEKELLGIDSFVKNPHITKRLSQKLPIAEVEACQKKN